MTPWAGTIQRTRTEDLYRLQEQEREDIDRERRQFSRFTPQMTGEEYEQWKLENCSEPTSGEATDSATLQPADLETPTRPRES